MCLVRLLPLPLRVREVLGHPSSLSSVKVDYTKIYSRGCPLQLSNLLKKDVDWRWHAEHAEAFKAIKESLLAVPIMALPNLIRTFRVVYDALDFGMSNARLQTMQTDESV